MIGRRHVRTITFGALPLFMAFVLAPEALARAAANSSASGGQADWMGIPPAALIAGAVVLLGHLLVVWRDALARTFSPKVEMAIQCEFFEAQGANRPFELRVLVTNKGGARSRFPKLTYWIRGIQRGTKLALYERKPPPKKDAPDRAEGLGGEAEDRQDWPRGDRLNFPAHILEGEIRDRQPHGRLFVDSGMTWGFTRAALVPSSISFILVHVEFMVSSTIYADERVFAVPNAP